MCVCVCVCVCMCVPACRKGKWTDRRTNGVQQPQHRQESPRPLPQRAAVDQGSGASLPLFSLFTTFLGAKPCEHRLPRDHERERLGDRPFVKSTCHVTGKLISAKPWLFQT